MSRRRVSNPLALAILVTLWESPMHPYEISRTLRERGKHESIKLNYGSLYSVVEQLQRHGLIEPVETIRDGRRPERTVYAATAAGLAEMEDWLSELLSTPAREYPQFEAALSLAGGLPPEDVVALLEQRIQRRRMEISADQSALEMTAAAGIPRLFLVELEYRIAMVEAEVAWVVALVDDIRSERLEGVALWRSYHAGDGPPPEWSQGVRRKSVQ